MEVRRLDPASGLQDLIKNLDTRLRQIETQPAGSIVIQPDNTLTTTDANTGVQTIFGALPDGTTGFQQFVGDTTPPNRPSTPVLTSQLGTVSATWDGLDSASGAPPKDYDRTDVEFSLDGTAFTVAGSLTSKGTVNITGLSGGQTCYVQLVSYDVNQNISAPSSVSSVTVVAAVDDSSIAAKIDSVNQTATAAQATADGKNASYYEPTQPTGGTYKSGDLWFDTSNNYKLYVYTGTAWQLAQDSATAQSTAVSAQNAAASAQNTANSAQSAAASAQSTANSAQSAAASAQTAANNAQSSANTAQSTATSKAQTFYQATQPTGGTYQKGDLWFNTANNYQLSTYSGTAWVLTQDSAAAAASAAQAQSTANVKNQTFISATAPTASAVGDLWMDTSNGNVLKRWSGSAWVNVQDTAINTAQLAANAAQATANSAQTTANGKNTSYYQGTQPSGGTYKTGDLWFNTADNYKAYVYSGSAWVLAQDSYTALTTSQAASAFAGTKGKVWFQSTAPDGGTSYGWTGGADASTSQQYGSNTLLRTNLATNPSFEGTSGVVTVRTNLALDPQATALAQWGSMGAGGQTVSVDTSTFYAGTSSVKTTCTASGQVGLAAMTSNPGFADGDYVSWSLWVFSNVAQSVRLYWERTTGAYEGGYAGSSVAVPANAWVQVSGTMQFASGQATATDNYHFGVLLLNPSAVGDTLNVDQIIVERVSSPGPYFDGSSTASGDYTYGWSNTINSSVSYQQAPGVSGVPQTSVYQSKAWYLSRGHSLRITPNSTTSNDSFASPGGDTGAMRLGMAAGHTYTASSTIRLSSALTGTLAGNAALAIAFYYRDSSGNYQATLSTAAGNAAGVTRLSVTVAIPVGATEAFVRLYHGGYQGSGDVWWDDFLLEESSSVGTYFDGSTPSDRTYDLWVNTAAGNKAYTWDANSHSWLSAQDTAIAAAANSASSAMSVAQGKNTTFISATAPTASATGDIWLDSSNGYRMNRWSGSAWVNVQDAAIAAAQSTANTAQTSANGKNTVTYSTSAASGSGTASGDTWFQTDGSGNVIAMWQWSGSAWVSQAVGNQVIAALDAGKITTGYLAAARIQAGTITASMIATDTITANQIAAGAITASELAAGAVTASAISAGQVNANALAANSITATALAANAVTATAIAADTITASQIAAGAITGSELAANSVSASALVANSITASAIAANAITASAIAAGTIVAGNGIVSSLDAGTITAGTLAAARISSKSITVDKLLVADTTDLIPDPYFSDSQVGGFSGPPYNQGTTYLSSNSAVPTGGLPTVPTVLAMPTGYDFAVADWFPVQPGDKFYIEGWVCNPSGTTDLNFGLWYANTRQYGGNSYSQAYMGSTAANARTWTKISGEVTIPSLGSGSGSAAQPPQWAHPWVTSGNGAGWWITGYHIRRKNGGELIIDGSITASKIAANSVSATALAANAVTATAIAASAIDATKLAANSITATAIAARTISTDKLVVFDSTNMVADGDFEQQGGAWQYNSGTTSLDTSGANAYTGNNSLKITGTNTGYGNCNNTQIMPMEPNAWYYWEYYYKTTASAAPNYGLRLAAASGSASSWSIGDNVPNAPQTTWAKRSGSFQIPSTVWAASARFDVSTGTATDSVWIDGFKLRRQNGAELIVDGSVTANELAAGSVTAGKIAAQSITATALAANSITATALAAQSITATALAAQSITATALAAQSITATALAAQSITATALAAQSITATALAAQSITATALGANSVTATAIAANTITATNGIVQSLDASTITAGTLAAARIGANTLTADKLVVGDMENRVVDPYMSGTGKIVNATYVSTSSLTVSAGAPYASAAYLNSRDSYEYPNGNPLWRPLTGGEQYWVEAWVRATSSATQPLNLGMWVNTDQNDSNWPVAVGATVAQGQAGWVHLTGKLTVPATINGNPVTKGIPWIQIAGTSGADITNWYITGWSTRRMNAGNLIVDGSITANSLAASSVTANALAAGSVTAVALAANSVTATAIKAGSITATAIAAGSITSTALTASAIQASAISAGAIDGFTINGANIVGGQITTSGTTGAVIARMGPGSVTADGTSRPGIGFTTQGGSTNSGGLYTTNGMDVTLAQGFDPNGGGQSGMAQISAASNSVSAYGYAGISLQANSSITIQNTGAGNLYLKAPYVSINSAGQPNQVTGGLTVDGIQVGVVKNVEYYINQTGVPNVTVWGPGQPPVVGNLNGGSSAVGWVANDTLRFYEKGFYAITWDVLFSTGCTGRTYLEFNNPNFQLSRSNMVVAEDHGSVCLPNLYIGNAGDSSLDMNFKFYQTTGATISVQHRIRVTKYAGAV